VLPVLFTASPATAAVQIPSERAQSKWSAGLPLLRGESLAPDPGFAQRWRDVCAAAEQPTANAIAEALRSGDVDSRKLMEDRLAGRAKSIHAIATDLGLGAAVAATVLRLTLLPQLVAISARWDEAQNTCRWDQGFCPICGSWPLLGEFRGLEQLRFLRCGFCAAGWEVPRLRCAFCSTTNHQQLGYFFVESEDGKHRATTCSACRGYVKMVSTLDGLPPPRLLVADVATLHLDLAAIDRGFMVD